jgi:hypothetical protein
MPSGDEQEPQYGGPEPTWRGTIVACVIAAAIGVGLILLSFLL